MIFRLMLYVLIKCHLELQHDARCCAVPINILRRRRRFQMTDWDAARYLKFEKERTRPAIDLLARISNEKPRTCVDIGCGPGNSTELLVNRFPEANITGLDLSPGMLAAAKLRLPHVDFEQIDLTHWRPRRPYDVIFASGSLQWLPDHEALFPRLASLLTVGGCLAVQMPDTLQEPIRALMRMVAAGDHGRQS